MASLTDCQTVGPRHSRRSSRSIYYSRAAAEQPLPVLRLSIEQDEFLQVALSKSRTGEQCPNCHMAIVPWHLVHDYFVWYTIMSSPRADHSSGWLTNHRRVYCPRGVQGMGAHHRN